MNYNFCAILIILIPVQLFAMSANDQAKQCRLYQNAEITSQNLYSLSRKMSPELQQAVNSWAKEHGQFLHTALPLTQDTITDKDEITTEQQTFKKIINEKFVNKSEKNASFDVMLNNEKWFIKFVGPERRAHAILHANNFFQQYTQLTKHLTRKHTYMTPSHVAGYLRAIEIIKAKKLTKFKVPATYLAQIPERTDITTQVNDENCFVIQENLPQMEFLDKNSKLITDIDEHTLYELYTIIKAVPLWDVAANLLFDQNDGSYAVCDLEQSWEEPDKFFNRDAELVKLKISNGIEELGLLIKLSAKRGFEVHEQHTNFVKFVQNDDYFQKLGIPDRIKKTLIL